MAKEMAAESSCRILELLWEPRGSLHPKVSSATAPRVPRAGHAPSVPFLLWPGTGAISKASYRSALMRRLSLCSG